MRDGDATTRELMADRLRDGAVDLPTLAREFDVTAADAETHVRHIARSLEGTGERLLVAPPECRDCGFDRFDDPANRPSRCPECKSENLTDPAFRVE